MRDFAPSDTETYPLIKKGSKIHDKPILNFHYYYDTKIDRHILVSVANDSVKTWAVTSFGDEMDMHMLQEYNNIRCGVQASDISQDGKGIIVVDTMNVLHVITQNEKGILEGSVIDEGMMQILFCKYTPDYDKIFSINYVYGMQTFDLTGQNPIRKPLERKRSVSAVVFSATGKIALGFDGGFFEVRDGEEWNLICRGSDSHTKKIRVVEFSHDGQYLLVGCDDKTLSLHRIEENSSTNERRYSYHTAPILSASFDYSEESSRFVSSAADQKVILWDTHSGNPIHIFSKCFSEQVITAVKFSQNGRYLFSGAANGHVYVHKMSSFFEDPVPAEIVIEEIIETEEMFEVAEPDKEIESNINDDEMEVQIPMDHFEMSDSDEENGEVKEGTPPESPIRMETETNDHNISGPTNPKSEIDPNISGAITPTSEIETSFDHSVNGNKSELASPGGYAQIQSPMVESPNANNAELSSPSSSSSSSDDSIKEENDTPMSPTE